jgi:uncharacterized protein (TIGR00369 family)
VVWGGEVVAAGRGASTKGFLAETKGAATNVVAGTVVRRKAGGLPIMTPLEKIRSMNMPFAELKGVTFTEAERDRVVARMLVRPDLCTLNHIIHGGAIMALADSVGAAATLINLPEDAKGTTTIESKTNFIGGAKEGATLIATATPVHRGRRTQVWQTRLETEDGKLVAVVTQTQMVL